MSQEFRKKVKKIFLKIVLFFGVLVVSLGFLYFSSPVYFKDKFVDVYFSLAKPCTEYHIAQESEKDPGAPGSCVFPNMPDQPEMAPNFTAFVSDVAAREFPGYRLVDAGLSFDSAHPEISSKALPLKSLVSAVWVCSRPHLQYLTTTTRMLALCSATPNSYGTGYDSAVKIYEVASSVFGVVGRQIHTESARAKKGVATSVLFNVDFDVLSEKPVANITKYELQAKRVTRGNTKILVYRERELKAFFEFDSLLTNVASSRCANDTMTRFTYLERFFYFPSGLLADGDVIHAFQSISGDGLDSEPGEGIPFVFSAKTWSIRRQYPLASGGSF